jgi:hypothetical protein
VDFEEFYLVLLPTRLVLRFCQGVYKNWRIDMTICLVDCHKPSIDYLVENVITTFNKLACRHPMEWLDDKLGPHPLFLWSRPKWKKHDDVWFTTILVGRNQLLLIVDDLTCDFP